MSVIHATTGKSAIQNVVVVGSFPPPITGQALVARRTQEKYWVPPPHKSCSPVAGWPTNRPCAAPRSDARRIGAPRIVLGSRDKVRLSACGCRCGAGLPIVHLYWWRDAAASRILIHHHSFYYVDQRLFLMQALTWLAGSAATHILLCDRMCQMFERQYPNALRTVAIANAFCVQADTALEALECASSGGRLTIGFLQQSLQ